MFVFTLENSDERAKALRELSAAYLQARQWEQAERVIGSIETKYERVEALSELGVALAQAQLGERTESVWSEAQKVIDTDSDRKARRASQGMERTGYSVNPSTAVGTGRKSNQWFREQQ